MGFNGPKRTLLNITTIVLVLVLKTTRSRFGLAKTYLLVGLSHHPPKKKTRYAIACRKLRSEHSTGVFVVMDKFAELWSFAHTHTILCQHHDWKRMSCNLIICLGWFWINPFGCYFTPRKVVVVCPLWCKCVSVCQHIVHHFCGAELLALAKTSFSWISFRANSLEEKHRVSNAFFSCCSLRHLHSRKFVSFPATRVKG